MTSVEFLFYTHNFSSGLIIIARLAQSVEHQTFNLRVMGSSPISGASTIFVNQNLSCSCNG